jgi:hypothetical protein
VLVAHQGRAAGHAHDFSEELRSDLVLQEPLPVPRERRVVEALLGSVHVQEPPEQQVVVELLAEEPLAPHAVERHQQRGFQQPLEINGSQHRDEAGLRYDAERDAALAAAGIKVLRFSNQEALAATEFVALEILDEVERLTAASPRPSVGSSRRRDALLPHPGPLPR